MIADAIQFIAMLVMAFFGVVMWSDLADLKTARRKELYNLPPPKAIDGPTPVCHCGGKWTKWEIRTLKYATSKAEGQKRSCEECGYTEIKKLVAG